MWGLLALFVTCIFLWFYINNKNGTSKSNYWADRGFRSLSKISLFELMTGLKSMGQFDLENYSALGDDKCGGVIELGNPLLYVKDLDLARNIFIKDFDNFFDRRDFAMTEPLFVNQLFFMKGQMWKNMRCFLSPTFTSGRIKRMFPYFGRSVESLKKFILAQPKSGQCHKVQISEAMRKYAIEVIGSAGFGLDMKVFENQDQTFFEMAENIFGSGSFSAKIKFAIHSNFPKISKLFKISFADSKAAGYFQEVLTASLKAREENYKSGKVANDDFMQFLVEARHGNFTASENDQKLSKEEEEAEIKSGNKNDIQWTDILTVTQAFNFLAGGFDTISNNLAIAVLKLAEHPKMQEKVLQEVKAITGEDEEVTYENVQEMEYLEMFVSEVLRLYPPVSRLDRKCMKDYPIPGSNQIIPKGCNVAFVAEGIHRDEKHFSNPLEFRPERFTLEEKAKRHPYAYLPFGHGPRNCLGMRFARVETKTALANIVKNFEISLPSGMETEDAAIRDVFGYKIKADVKLQFSLRDL